MLDGAFAVEGKRQVDRRLAAIKSSTAPIWENSASTYEAMLPLFESNGVFSRKFGSDFRNVRNQLHVSHHRTRLDLGTFFKQYHGILWLLYCDVVAWKGKNVSEVGGNFSL